MLELYVLATLGSLGYFFKQQQTVVKNKKAFNNRKIKKSEIPSHKNVYGSNYTRKIKSNELKRATRHLKQKNVVHINEKNHNFSRLAGVPISDFKHNNMVPFFSGTPTQNTAIEIATDAKLEAFTGVSRLPIEKKKEKEAMFPSMKQNTTGFENTTQFQQERVNKPQIQNNVTPVPQIKVGPGLGQGYTANPVGGFHQIETRDFALPKKVEDLRTANNPKLSYKGRVIEGQKNSLRGKIGKVSKNRVSNLVERKPEDFQKTTGSFLKPKSTPNVEAKATNRNETTTEYKGAAYINKASEKRANIQQSNKEQLPEFGISNVVSKGGNTDHGKASIQIYSNERDNTSTKVYQGNVMSVVKAIIAPLQDMVKSTKKEEMTENKHQGSVNLKSKNNKAIIMDPTDIARPTIKETIIYTDNGGNITGNIKLTAYNPDDIARTTNKETTIANDLILNTKGNNKGVAYDPNDISKTTIKETTLSQTMNANIKGEVKNIVYDPKDTTRCTLKETTLSDADRLNLQGPLRISIFDRDDLARTTIKQTTLQENEAGNLAGNIKNTAYNSNKAKRTVKETTLQQNDNMNIKCVSKTVMYNPNEVMRPTIKQTTLKEQVKCNLKGDVQKHQEYNKEDAKPTIRQNLETVDYSTNIKPSNKAHIVYDPTDLARTTIKETSLGGDYSGVANKESGTGYKIANVSIEPTQKQFISDNDYTGIPAQESSTAYQIVDQTPKETQKELLTDNDHFGGVKSSDEKMMSYNDIYNATINEIKEGTLVGRAPTKSGVKTAIGADKLNVQSSKVDVEDNAGRAFEYNDDKTGVFNNNVGQSTRSVETYDSTVNRLDNSIINAYIENPYTQSLNSVA